MFEHTQVDIFISFVYRDKGVNKTEMFRESMLRNEEWFFFAFEMCLFVYI